MLKRVCGILFALFVGVAMADVGPIANIEYIHGSIDNIWGVEIDYNAALKNPLYASNMEYLLTAVDRANYVINGFESTSYRKDAKYATKLVASVATADSAINELIREEGLVFRTLRTTSSFSLKIAAKGDFRIDWGDGTVDEFTQTTTAQKTYSHTYDKAGVYYIKPRGAATEYNSDGFTPSIKIGTPTALATINGSLGSVFPTLSNGSQPSFYGTFAGCTNLRGKIPEDLFEGVHGQADKWYMFALLFDGCTKLQGPIPESLFASVTGKPVQGMFEATFRNCSSLKGSIPEKLFQSVAGDMPNYLFNMTFQGCSSLTGSIPGDLFKTITGQPGIAGFYRLFRGCSGLRGGIPGTLFQNLNGESQDSTFAETFAGMSIGGKIPATLFQGVTGRPGVSAFWGTFQGTNFTAPIPEDLFASMSGAPRSNSFRAMFHQSRGTCSNMPAGLFRTIQGEPAPYMFASTFIDCGVNRIPEGLFSGIKGPPAEGMFDSTFHWNNIGAIPAGLFAGISGAPAANMFRNTFDSTWGISKIGAPLFGDLRGTAASGMFSGTFNGSSAIKGPSAQMQIVNADGSTENRFIYEFWDMTSNQNTYSSNASGMDDYACIPKTWGGGGTQSGLVCSVYEWPFSMTTTALNAGDEFWVGFQFTGTAYVDWGDGDVEQFVFDENTSSNDMEISHIYAEAGTYTIRLAAKPTEYWDGEYFTTFVVYSTDLIASIDGSLGAVFPTLADGSNPCFAGAFGEATNLTTIPENLFSGISGVPNNYMFFETFKGCTGLTEIPTTLFAGINQPATATFMRTFDGCTGITSIPENLFVNMTGTPAEEMYIETFAGCSSLKGESARLNGDYFYNLWPDLPGVFDAMYYGCTGLTDYADIPMSWKTLE